MRKQSWASAAGRGSAVGRRAFCAAATLLVASAGAFNWSDYPAGAVVTVTGNATATDADMATINAYSKLCFASGTQLTFDISGDESLTCPVAATGTIVKCGTGSFTVSASAAHGSANTFRYVDFEVEEGVLKTPQDDYAPTDFWVRKVTVGENGTFVTVPNAKNTNIEGGLWGSGIVTNTSTGGSSQLRVMNVSSTPCVFSGRILGKGIRWYSGGNAHLTGTNSLFSGSFQLWNGNGDIAQRGTTGVAKIGNPGEPSSVGSTLADITSREMGSRILYLGKGETTSRNYVFYNNHSGSSSMHYWDAGAHGGVTFTGRWSHNSSHPERLVLMGSNTAPCVIQGEWTGDSSTNPTYIIKRGSGTWRFAHNSNRTLSGTIAVEDGTLEFETIAEVGANCSLGQATCLQSSYTAAYDASRNVDYAYLLGTASSTGTLAYVGTSDAACRSRPIAVTGRGRLRTAGTGGLALSGAFAATAAGGTFVLDAPAGRTNSVSLVRDGAAGGFLNVEKTGAGVWALDGTNTFSGSLAVKEGTLLVRNAPCPWFRFTVMETTYGQKKRLGETAPNDANTEIQELALYDADGVRRNLNMAFHTTYGNVTALPVGHACWTRTDSINYYNDRDGDKMFDDASSGNGCCISYSRNGATLVVRLDAPSSWIPVVMHLDPQGPPITAFDVLTKNATSHGRTPVAYKFDVSHDGWDWRTVYTETNTPAASSSRWMSNPSESFVAGAVRPGKGFSIANLPLAASEILPNVSDVSVAPNAVLEALGDVELKTLSVDASGAGNGAVKGFSFAEAGTLCVSRPGTTAGPCEIPMSLEGCTGLANVAKWDILFNGTPTQNFRAKATPAGIVVMSAGTLLIMR